MYFLNELFGNIFYIDYAFHVTYFIYDIIYSIITGWNEFRFTAWLYIISILFIPSLSILLYFLFNKIKIYITKKNKSDEKKWINIISLFYLFFPGWYFIYPILLCVLNINIKKQIKFIFLWSLIYHFYLYLIFEISHVNNIVANSISIIRFFPLFILLFFIWKPLWRIKNILKNTIIILLILIFYTQPFYKNWFYENNKASTNQSICYDREKVFWPCFKIFKWIRID